MREPDEDAKSFTSWKLAILDAISCDAALTDLDFRVAYRIMQHVNKSTRDCHPSIDRIAAQIGVSRHTVMRSLSRLCDPDGQIYWLKRERPSRQHPYIYSFVEDRVDVVLDAKIYREEQAKDVVRARVQNRLDVAAVQHRDVAAVQHPVVANDAFSVVAAVQHKHLHENYLPITPAGFRAEADDSLCAREEPIPDREIEFARWIVENIPDRSRHREALKLLRDRKMTPEILARMAA